jgi:hypothetical protein
MVYRNIEKKSFGGAIDNSHYRLILNLGFKPNFAILLILVCSFYLVAVVIYLHVLA